MGLENLCDFLVLPTSLQYENVRGWEKEPLFSLVLKQQFNRDWPLQEACKGQNELLGREEGKAQARDRGLRVWAREALGF